VERSAIVLFAALSCYSQFARHFNSRISGLVLIVQRIRVSEGFSGTPGTLLIPWAGVAIIVRWHTGVSSPDMARGPKSVEEARTPTSMGYSMGYIRRMYMYMGNSTRRFWSVLFSPRLWFGSTRQATASYAVRTQ